MLTLTLRLDPGAEREGALDELIAAQSTPGSPQYRQWLSPAEFGSRFGASDDRIAAVATWLESNGLTVTAVSPSKLRLTVAGSGARVEAAFGARLRMYRGESDASGDTTLHFASVGPTSVPQPIAALLAGVSGLEGQAGGSTDDPLTAVEHIVDGNAESIVSVGTKACSSAFAPSEVELWRTALKQAEAQGITVLAATGCGADGASSPASLPEVTAVVLPNTGLAATVVEGVAARPSWQFAEGLPPDGWREEPDAAVSSESALVAALAGISRTAGTRLGNVAPVLYALAKSPGLFTQQDGTIDETRTGRWERPNGLGTVDLKRLADLFPRGSIGTSSLLTVSNYAPYHGQPLTLTATVTSTGGSGVPTGTVTFTSTQKGTLGTATLNASGVAMFTSNSLEAGMYTTTSVYSGDATYVGSTSGVATITILGELSLITATVEPGAAVGGNAAVDVSITSASGVGTPSGTVTVAPQGTTNPATAKATLTGSNGTATATVLLPVEQAGEFTLLVSCSDPDPSFTCYSPVSVQMSVGKGATTTALSGSPVDPAAGQPYTLTASVSGTGRAASSSSMANRASARRRSFRPSANSLDTSAYSGPTGNVQFMDGTQYLATAALASGVATFMGTSNSSTHSFSAMYSGDANYGTSSSNAVTTTGTTPTSTSVTASASSIGVGQSVTFSATVTATGVPPTMTGTITFTAVGQGVLGTAAVTKGAATLTLATLAAGSYSVTASYSGDSVFAPSTSTMAVTVSVAAGASTIAVTSNVASALSGVAVLLTATVTGSAAGAPSGKVSVYDSFGGVLSVLGSATLASQTMSTSVASLSVTGLAAGSHSIYAVYAGDSTYLGSTSPAITLGSTSYAITLMPTTLTLKQGQAGQATLSVSYQGGFGGTVSFGCVPPANIEMTCSFSPTELTAGGSTTLAVGTVAPISVSGGEESEAVHPGRLGVSLTGEVAFALLLLGRRRRLPSVLLLLLAMSALLGATGCSGTNLGQSGAPTPIAPSDPGTALGTQLLSITTAGSDGVNTVRHDFQYQVTVQ
jgi:hypothetical protein